MQQQQHGAHWTLVGDDTVAVANGGFCLDGEEEGRDEAVDIVDARRPRLILQMVQITPWEEKKCERWKGGGCQSGCQEAKIDREREEFYFFLERRCRNISVTPHLSLYSYIHLLSANS